jgi:hypothetical protein
MACLEMTLDVQDRYRKPDPGPLFVCFFFSFSLSFISLLTNAGIWGWEGPIIV